MAKIDDFLKSFSKTVDAVNKTASKAGVKPAEKPASKQSGAPKGKTQSRTVQKPKYTADEMTTLIKAQPITPRLTRADGSTWEPGKPLPALNRAKLLGGASAVMLPDNRTDSRKALDRGAALAQSFAKTEAQKREAKDIQKKLGGLSGIDLVMNGFQASPQEQARRELVGNSLKWHTAPQERARLEQANREIRAAQGWGYDEPSGVSYDPATMQDLVVPTEILTGKRKDQSTVRQKQALNDAVMDADFKLDGTLRDIAESNQGRFQQAAKSVGNTLRGGMPAWTATGLEALDQWEAGQTEKWLQGRRERANTLAAKTARTAGEQAELETILQQLTAANQGLYDKKGTYRAEDTKAYQWLDDAGRQQQNALQGLSGTQRFLAQNAMSMANNLAVLPAAALGPMAPALLMGAQAAGSRSHELMGQGASAGEAFLRGGISGGIEALTEKFSVGSLLDLVKTGGKGVIANLLKQAGVEASEEMTSYTLNYLADKAAKDPNAQFSFAELLEQGAGGALSGLVFGAGGTAANYAGDALVPKLMQKTGAIFPGVDKNGDKLYNQTNEGGGVNGTGQVDYSGGRNGLPQNDFGIGMADDSAGLRGTARSSTQTGETTGRGRAIYSTDSDGRSITIETIEKLSGTAIADNESRPVSVYHFTPNMDFTTFDKGDVGFHFGTEQQAANRQGDKGAGRTIRSYLNIKNPYRAKADIMNWHADAVATRLWADGLLNNAEADRVCELAKDGRDYHSEASKTLRDILAAKGYDGISYPNGFEGEGDSYIAFYPEQVIIADDGKGGGKGGTPESSVGAAESGFDPYSRMQNEHGTIPPGEQPRAREVDVPQSTDGSDRVSRFTRTMMEANATPDSMIADFEQGVAEGDFSYEPRKQKDILNKQVSFIENSGYAEALRQWDGAIERGSMDDSTMILGQVLYAEAAKAGDVQTAMKLAAELAAEGTRAGQTVSAQRMLKRLTPEGRLYYAERSVENLSKSLQKKYGDRAPNLQISEELTQNLLNAKTTQEMDTAQAALFTDIANQMPSTWQDKWDAWRYTAMLGNPRTHIRNIVGNFVFGNSVLSPRSVKNKVGAVLETAADKASRLRGGEGIERTKSLTTKRADRAFARQDFKEMQSVLQGTGKYNTADSIKSLKTNPFGNNLLARGLNKLSNLNSAALEAEDVFALKGAYVDSLAQYMKSNGLKSADMTGATLEKARTYAVSEAQKATFRDANALSTALNKFSKGGGKLRQIAVEGLIPFKKTPANIVSRGVEYSPYGLLKGVKQMAVDVHKGNKSAAQAIDTFSAGLTGTGIMALGVYLASQGLVSGGGDDDSKKQYFDEMGGAQSYALDLSPFGIDKTYTIDWSAPASLPLFVGVELWNAMQQGEENLTAKYALEALSNITEPIFNLTMMDGINRAIKNATYDSGTPISSALLSAGTDYFTQGVPTLLGQINRSFFDDTRRSTYIEHDSPIPKIFDREIQRQMAKIPGLSKKLNPYTDSFGREQKNGSWMENFFSPGYLSDKKSTEAEKALSALYDATGDSAVLPSKPQKYITVNGEKKWLTAHQYLQYANGKGQASLAILNKAVESELYKGMSDGDKAAYVLNVYKYADQISKSAVFDCEPDSWVTKTREAAQNGVPVETALAYRTLYGALTSDKDENGDTVYSQNDKLRDMLFEADLPAEQKNALDNLLITDKKEVDYSSGTAFLLSQLDDKQRPKYQAAMDAGVSYDAVEDFRRFYNAADSKDENGSTVSGLKKERVLEYLSQSGMTAAQQRTVLETFTTYKTDDITLTERAVNSANSWAVNPVKAANATVVSGYGLRNAPNTTYGKGSSNHRGIDIGGTGGNLDGQEADTVGDGTVQTVAYDPTGYGNYVIIDHGNGYKTLYGHLQKATVQQGQTVSAGQQIGVIGGTGNVEAPHLHLSAWKNGQEIDPATVIPGF